MLIFSINNKNVVIVSEVINCLFSIDIHVISSITELSKQNYKNVGNKVYSIKCLRSAAKNVLINAIGKHPIGYELIIVFITNYTPKPP